MASSSVCVFYNSKQGCRYGSSCHYVHKKPEQSKTTQAVSTVSHVNRPFTRSCLPENMRGKGGTAVPAPPAQNAEEKVSRPPVPVEALWDDESTVYYDPHVNAYDANTPAYSDILKSNIDADQARESRMEEPSHTSNKEVCSFFLASNCKFGDRCRYLHVGREDEDKLSLAAVETGPMECGICIEPPKGSLYGLLSHCNCKFCLTCIRSWRNEGVSVTKDNKQVRVCPLCRKESYFVVPSSTFPQGSEKEMVIQAFKDSLAKKPCRYYQTGRCPFGSSCFYMHETDGSKGTEVTHRNVGQLNLSDLLNFGNRRRRIRYDEDSRMNESIHDALEEIEMFEEIFGALNEMYDFEDSDDEEG